MAKKDSRTYHLKKKYEITPEEYDAILESQNGGCFGCGRKPKPGQNRLAVDHDHKLGNTRAAVRALLCWFCNRVLGRMERYKISGTNLDRVLHQRPAQKILARSNSLATTQS